MLAERTELIRARVSQEVRVILPPCGQKVMYDPTAPCPGSRTPAEAQVLEATGFGDLEEETTRGAVRVVGEQLHYERVVQILVPTNPKVYFGLDITPEEVGPNRGNYKLPPLAAGTTIKLKLRPEQFIVAAADVSMALLTLIVEYYEEAP